jgi:hypothetical protein
MSKLTAALLASFIFHLPAVAGPGHDHGKDHKPMNGGLFFQAAYDYELVVKDGEVKLFVTDHGKPVSLAGASAKLSILEGVKKTDIDLMPSGVFFSAKTGLKPVSGAKAVVQVKIGGKSSTARFTF